MAKVVLILLILMVTASSFSTAIYTSSILDTTSSTKLQGSWFEPIACNGNERTAKIHLYVQDFIGGPNQTVYQVANASITSSSPTSFGLVEVLDDLMTVGPDLNSEAVGRFQGFYTISDLRTTAYTMIITYYFTSGPGSMNGSTIIIAGRNPIMEGQREHAVIGGSGMFRFATGYNILSTLAFVVPEEYLILESTIYVTYKDDSTPCNYE